MGLPIHRIIRVWIRDKSEQGESGSFEELADELGCSEREARSKAAYFWGKCWSRCEYEFCEAMESVLGVDFGRRDGIENGGVAVNPKVDAKQLERYQDKLNALNFEFVMGKMPRVEYDKKVFKLKKKFPDLMMALSQGSESNDAWGTDR